MKSFKKTIFSIARNYPRIRSLGRPFFQFFKRRMQYRIPIGMSDKDFFAKINSLDVKYVLLRWEDELSNIQLRDIDILVNDDDINKVLSVLTRSFFSNGKVCDVFSVSGNDDFFYKSMPYFPRSMAENILENTKKHPELDAKIPNDYNYMRSYIYHAIYHKGSQSTIPFSGEADFSAGSKYLTIIRKMLSDRGDFNGEINFLNLHQYMIANKSAPGIDLMGKLAEKNDWCDLLYKEFNSQFDNRDGETYLFVLRDSKYLFDAKKHLLTILQSKEIDYDVRFLNEIESNCIKRIMRSGIWEPYADYAGYPRILIIGNDRFKVDDSKHASDVASIKLTLREIYGENLIHSTDCSGESIYYMDLFSKKCSIN